MNRRSLLNAPVLLPYRIPRSTDGGDNNRMERRATAQAKRIDREDFEMSCELPLVHLECHISCDEDDVAVTKPKASADTFRVGRP